MNFLTISLLDYNKIYCLNIYKKKLLNKLHLSILSLNDSVQIFNVNFENKIYKFYIISF